MSAGPHNNGQSNPNEIELIIFPAGEPKQYFMQLRYTNAGVVHTVPPTAVPFTIPPEFLNRRAGYLTHTDYGTKLGAALFINQEINNILQRALGARQAGNSQALRLRVSCDDDTIQSLHWETLHFNGAPIFMDGVALSRYLSPSPQATSLQTLSQKSPRRSALRVLIFIAGPPGLENEDDSDSPPDGSAGKLSPIDIGKERTLAEEALKSGAKGSGIRITTEFLGSPGNATLEALRLKLAEGDGFDLLYLVCHGACDDTGAYLYLESQSGMEGSIEACRAEDLVKGLVNPPRLVVLASCESAGTGDVVANRKIPFWSKAALGPQLARAGVHSVIAMQGKVRINTAEHFARPFLSELCQHGHVDRALTIARANIQAVCPHDYWMPVLFSSSTSGMLFEPCSPASERVNNVPSLPSGFVARPLLQAEIVAALSRGTNTVLLGAGGFGKTTLTIAACRSEELTEAFPGGVLWTSLGTAPDLVQILTDLYVTAKGARPEVAGREQLVQVLAKVLKESDWLLTLDDVWRAEDLEPFLRLGARSLLVSTRKQNLVQEAGQEDWQEVQIGEITVDAAAAFLARGLGLEGPPPAAYCSLAEQLGGWPLLLDLVNARLREEKKTRPDFLAYVIRLFEKKGVLGFDRRDTNKRTLAVALSVEVGLDRAEQMYPGLARKAAEISIFPENIPIPFQVLQDLWASDEFDLEEDVLRPLTNLSLVRRDHEGIRVHMMIDRALKERQNKADGGSAAVHRRLIEAWGELHRLPHDYAWRWFGWHCVQAGESARLKGLLLDLKWLQAKLDATDSNALIGDFELLSGGAPELNLLRTAVQLSAHVLAKDKSLLAGQLLGRIPESEKTLREGILKGAVSQNRTWLRPLRPSLTTPGGPLLRTLEGHYSHVSGVAVTTDGERVVSSSYDGMLKVWDLETGVELRTLDGRAETVPLDSEFHRKFYYEHRGSYSGVAVTPDAKKAVSAWRDGAGEVFVGKVWELETGKELLTLKGHSDCIYGVAVTADGTRAISASSDNTLKVWDLETGEELYTLEGHSDVVHCVVVTADGKCAISASWDGTLKVWDLKTGENLRTLKGHTYPYRVTSVAVTADGTLAVSGAGDKTLKVWDLETGKERLTLKGHSDWVNGVAVTADGTRAISASSDHTLKLWDLRTGMELCTLEGHSGGVLGVALTPGGERAVSASEDETLKLWDLRAGVQLSAVRGQSAPNDGLARTPDRKRAFFGTRYRNGLKVWDLETGEELRTLEGHSQRVTAVVVTGDGKFAVSASRDDTLKIWAPETGAELHTLKGHSEWVTCVAVTSDGKWAVSGSWDKTLKVWDLETGEELRTLKGHSNGVTCVAVTSDGKWAVSGSWDNTLKIWDLETGEERLTLGDALLISCLAVSADGKWAVSGSFTRLTGWDLEKGQKLGTREGHSDDVTCVAVTPDGKRAASGCKDKTLKVWDLKTGAVLATFTCDGSVHSCAFTSEGEVIADDALGRLHVLRLEEPHSGLPDA